MDVPGPVEEAEVARVKFIDGTLVRSLSRVRLPDRTWLVQRFNLDLGLAFAEDGSEVHLFGTICNDLEYVSSIVAGPVASFLRWQRGWPSLHASAVVVDGRVLAVAGASGAGKSTTIAALALAGYPLFCDDLLGWRTTAAAVFASPGPGRVKLWPDTLAALGVEADKLTLVRQDLTKLLLPLPEADGVAELPLGAIYLLDPEAKKPVASVTPVEGTAAFVALKANCRDNVILPPGMRGRQFAALAELARRVPVRMVPTHTGLDRLDAMVSMLTNDFRSLPPASAH